MTTTFFLLLSSGLTMENGIVEESSMDMDVESFNTLGEARKEMNSRLEAERKDALSSGYGKDDISIVKTLDSAWLAISDVDTSAYMWKIKRVTINI